MSDEELELLVNGESRRVPASCTVTGLLGLLGMGDQRVAVAVNREVVPNSTHAARELRCGDRVEILEAVGGG